MTAWLPKDPGETVAYNVDWTDQLGADTILTQTMTASDGDAVIGKTQVFDRGIRFYVSGGTADTTTTFVNSIITAEGQTLERTYSLYVAAGASSYRPTSTTKRKLIEAMFEECGVNGWEYDIQPEEKDKALTRLDALMWELRGRGIDIGYTFPTAIGEGDLDDPLGCPDQAFYGLAVLGAERLAPTMGKTQSLASRMALTSAMKAVRSAAACIVPTICMPRGVPLGSGNRWRNYGWL